MFQGNLVIEKTLGGSDRFSVYRPLTYQTDSEVWVIPEGFKTDLTTFWLEGRHTECAVLHDFVLHVTGGNSILADRVMRQAMVSVGVSYLSRKIIMAGLRLKRIMSKRV